MKAEKIRERVKKKYENLRSIKIDEWGVEIYFRPITVKLEQHIKAKFKDLVDEESKAVEVVMCNTFDDERNPIWTTEQDRAFLREEVDSPILARIIDAMRGMSFEEAKKNSK